MSPHVILHDDITGRKAPWGLRWRASVWFITLGLLLGITTDLVVYSILIPVLPFHLEDLGYSGVSALVGYLLFAYSGGLSFSTPPIAWVSERYNSRKIPLMLGLIALAGSQIMMMEAPAYWVMALARVLQGISSSVVWTAGLALLCDTTPEKYVGQQLGLAMTGLSLGQLVGPPVGGALFNRFGFRGPCIFGVIMTMVDLLGRLLLVERKEAIKWGFDPAAVLEDHVDEERASSDRISSTGPPMETLPAPPLGSVPRNIALSPLAVVMKLARSPRALTALTATLLWGLVYSAQEPALPLHLQDVWGLQSAQVGLVYVAAVVPALFSSPAAGWWADHKGTEWITLFSLILALPWWCLLIVEKQLALFVAAFAMENLFTAALVAPLTTELASVARDIPGVGYAHVYGAFNLAYGLGSTVYNHIQRGWMTLVLISVGLLTGTIALAFFYTGERPIFTRLLNKLAGEGTITLSEGLGNGHTVEEPVTEMESRA
ncbi:major facilitator superfamily domain-containing protein [Amylostereum chailletii]|nr:major facilitator superfamily domain-containing protein [Amylostereum chailletii]